jgi:hypothetical protein
VDEPDFRSLIEPEILWEAEIQKNGYSWIAAKLEVRHYLYYVLHGDNHSASFGGIVGTKMCCWLCF